MGYWHHFDCVDCVSSEVDNRAYWLTKEGIMRRYVLFFSTLVSSFAFGVAGSPDTATLNWTNPTTYTDGTALDVSIAQTNITCSAIIIGGVRSGCTLAPASVAGLATTYVSNYTFTNMLGGQICWTVETQLADGRVSAPSNEACKTEAAPPKVVSPPKTLTVL
jgi:hypothetical protein